MEMLIGFTFKLWKIAELCNTPSSPIITELITEFSDKFVKLEMKMKRLN